MQRPLISVIIPAYNAQETLVETIESVRRQTFPDFELLVVDDGSTDQTYAKARSIDDSRIAVSSYPNQGLAVSRNRGIAQSKGEFLTFLDADDLWTPDKLELQLEALRENSAAAVAYSWTAFVDSKGQFLFSKERSREEGDVYEALLGHAFIASGSNILVRRESAVAVGGFDETLAAAQDWDFCLRIAANSPFALVRKYQIFYRISEAAMSANAVRIERSCLHICDRAFSGPRQVAHHHRGKTLSNVKQYVAFLYLSRSKDRDFRRRARHKLGECIRLHPPTLLTRKTCHLLLTLCVLAVLPRRLWRKGVFWLLRIYGRLLWLTHPEVRTLVKLVPRG